jgi:hypothetical protein
MMKFNNKYGKYGIFIAIAVIVSGSVIGASKKNNDDWNWIALGSVDNQGNMFPGTMVSKFRDEKSGVVCYIYKNIYANSVTNNTNGKITNGVAGDQIGTMSCVAERR